MCFSMRTVTLFYTILGIRGDQCSINFPGEEIGTRGLDFFGIGFALDYLIELKARRLQISFHLLLLGWM